MTQRHPEVEAEQAHVDEAYDRLEETRQEALRLKDTLDVGKGGTFQARWEREVFYENIANRLRELDLGERSLCFGRIDQSEEAGAGSYHIGRIAVSSDSREPLIVDWRAPVAESFYRATGSDAQGLVRRRHFTSRGRTVLDLEDEFFGEAAVAGRVVVDGRELRGTGALVHALEENRTGRLGDIVGTIQGEQDEIIRSGMHGVLVVQGGPGTGKTVVALHRAAYLLYTHRFPLEGQGVLVVGPNKLFLGYIEQVLPSLGEAGVEMAVLADLIPAVRVSGRDEPGGSRIKGDLRMVNLVRRAVQDRQRPWRSDLVVPMGARRIRVPAAESERIVAEARRRYRTHNSARKFVVNEFYEALAAHHPDGMSADAVSDQIGGADEVREALNWMWPVLTPAQLLHDLYGSRALIRSASGASAKTSLSAEEQRALYRPWAPDKNVDGLIWTVDDVPVLDEAMERLGPRPNRRGRPSAEDEVRTFGHIVVDEAQDLSPMQLRMLTRRSLNGSMTIVGDIAQSTGAWAHGDWDEVLEHLPDKREPRRAELTVGYRIPAPSMELAARILVHAAPDLKPPVSIRTEGDAPRFVAVRPAGLNGQEVSVEELVMAVVTESVRESGEGQAGNVAVIVPRSLVDPIHDGFEAAGVVAGRAPRDGLSQPITVVPVNVVKGLEVDVAVVVEPALILEQEPQPARSLYVACTRATKRLLLVHGRPLPEMVAAQ